MIPRNFKLLPVFRSPIRSCLGLSNVAESNLAKLRRKTGLSFILCKKALELHNNDVDAATTYLEEESIKQGYIKAAKLQTRKTVHGLIGVYLNQQAGRCALLELNCETDFVARNSNFIELTSQLTRASLSVEDDSPTGDHQIIRKINSSDSPYIQDRISQAITKLGENIKLSKSIVLQFDTDLLAYHHAHASGDFIPDHDDVKLGKYGTVVFVRHQPVEPKNEPKMVKEKLPPPKEEVVTSSRQLTDEEIDNEEFEFVEEPTTYTTDDIGRILCLQIIGMKPDYLKKPTDPTIKKKISDDVALLSQKIIVDPTLTVANFCDNHGIQVLDFVRIECGDGADEQ